MIAKYASPSVSRMSGSASSVRIGLTIAFAMPNTAAPMSTLPQSPISTPSKIESTTRSATTLTPHPMRSAASISEPLPSRMREVSPAREAVVNGPG